MQNLREGTRFLKSSCKKELLLSWATEMGRLPHHDGYDMTAWAANWL